MTMIPKRLNLTARHDRSFAGTFTLNRSSAATIDFSVTPVTNAKLQVKATRGTAASALLTMSTSSITNTAASAVFTLSASAVDVDAVAIGSYWYDIKITLSDGSTYTPLEGEFAVKESVTT